MAEGFPRLLGNFQFRISLLKAAEIEAGSTTGPNDSLAPPGEGTSDENLLGDGGFQECSGLEVSMDVQEYLEGGRNDGVIQRVGRAKYTNIVLKRGMFYGEENRVQRELWQWIQKVVSGKRPVPRYDGIIEVLDPRGEPDGETLATWVFERGLPAKIAGPQLNAKSGDIAIEELHIAHQGLRLLES
ncbi:phage tail protein [Microbulbifer rhizosphaerae]|uniref:Phage tail-like protein n=1 Tax=Microbulbifer rhizosphaerae TaxID=1562603 RepID=A0A7W4ZAS7_9GAMM|nr:phage tail protein [Microbulbifer rhizosphaerae]MBB3063133.1 phage tail-like protein [Microbulbifer rhizosphaerae]